MSEKVKKEVKEVEVEEVKEVKEVEVEEVKMSSAVGRHSDQPECLRK